MKHLPTDDQRPALHPQTIGDVMPDEIYAQGHLSGVIMSDGRKLDEALRNHPLAPSHETLNRPGKFFRGTDIIAFYDACEGRFSQSFGRQLSEESRRIALARAEMAKEAAATRAAMAALEAERERAEEHARAAPAQLRSALAGILREADAQACSFADMRVSGVYFLFRGSELIYVGQSVNILARITQHAEKAYDSVRFVRCPPHALNDVEGFFIRLLEPPMNKSRHGVVCAPRSEIQDISSLLRALHKEPAP